MNPAYPAYAIVSLRYSGRSSSLVKNASIRDAGLVEPPLDMTISMTPMEKTIVVKKSQKSSIRAKNFFIRYKPSLDIIFSISV